jgi:Uncharacterized proteins involved in stress response, homologs of TerZ and putative cAMP-binding protein CABP1
MIDMGKDAKTVLSVKRLYVGVGWKSTAGGKKGVMGAIKRRQGTDLDAWAVALDANGVARAIAWFDDQDPYENGSLLVSDDDKTGRGPGDDEFLTADLERISGQVQSIIFGVSAYKPGVTFQSISSVSARIVDQGDNNRELGNFMLPVNANVNSVALCKVVRRPDNTWEYTTTELLGNARDKAQIINLAASA